MPDFSKRSTELEIMDDLLHPPEVINQVLVELDRINYLLGGYAITINALNKLDLKSGDTISDWGCGGADSIKKIEIWAKKKKLELNYVGIDAAKSIIEFAKKECIKIPKLNFMCCDVFSDEIRENSFTIVSSTLFTHHFEEDNWINLIKKMYQSCTKAVIINDLNRHWFAYYSIKFLTNLFSKSAMVKNDAPLSVLRSFKKIELESMLAKAGIKTYTLKWAWAFRWQLIIYK